MKKNLFKKSLSVLLSVLMLMSCWVWVAPEHTHVQAALADTTELDNAIAAYENKMNGTIYKNMQNAYFYYITALEARDAYKYGGNTSVDISTAATNLYNAINAMTEWNLSASYTKVTPSFANDSGGSYSEGTTHNNIIWTRTTTTSDKRTFTRSKLATAIVNAPTVLVIDGDNTPKMPILSLHRGSTTRYVYKFYPSTGDTSIKADSNPQSANVSTTDHSQLSLADKWHSNGTYNSANFIGSWSTQSYAGIGHNSSTSNTSKQINTGSDDYFANVLQVKASGFGEVETHKTFVPQRSATGTNFSGEELYFYRLSGNGATDHFNYTIAYPISVINYAALENYIKTYAGSFISSPEATTVDSVDLYYLFEKIDAASTWNISHSNSGKTSSGNISGTGLTQGYNYYNGDSNGTNMITAVNAVGADMVTLAVNVSDYAAKVTNDINTINGSAYANLRSKITTSEAIYSKGIGYYTEDSWSSFENAYKDAQSFMAQTQGKYYAEAGTAQSKYSALKSAREALKIATSTVTFDNLVDFNAWKSLTPGNATVSNITDNGFTLTSNEGAGEGTFESPYFAVEPGKSYKISMDFVGDAWDVYIFFCNEAGGWVDFGDGPTNRYSSNGSTGISKDNAVFTAPDKPEVVKAKIRVDANGSNNTVSYSNIRVYEVGKVVEGVSYINSITVNAGEAYGTLPTPEKGCYVFNGWVDAAGNAVTASSVNTSKTAQVLYSTWGEEIHTEANREDNRQEPNCATPGSYDAVVYCSKCNKELSRSNVEIPATGNHTFTNYVSDNNATCKADGTKTAVCDVCKTEKHTVTDTGSKDKVAHTPGASATCTTAQTCTVCGAELVAKLGHTEVIIPAVDATCTTPGKTEGKQCSVCGTITVPQTDTALAEHTYDKQVATDTYKATDATCKVKATYYYSCSCGAKGTETFEYGELAAHTPGAAATCTTAQTCTVCGVELNAMLGHLDEDKNHICDRGCGATQGTCSDSATDNDHLCDYGCGKVLEDCYDQENDTDHKCNICGKDNITEHIKGEETRENVTEATCSAAGKYDSVYYCTECNAEVERTNDVTIAQLPHSWSGAAYTWSDDAKSCTVTRTCANNAEHKESETVNTVGTKNVEETCEAKGSTIYTATFTKDWATKQTKEVYDIPEKGHNMQQSVEAVAPTCTVPGKTAVLSCVNGCGKTEGGEEVSATGHSMVAGEVVAPNCEADGYTVYTCANNCGHTENRDVVSANGHSYVDVVTPPTCTEKGFTTHTCSVCGDNYVDGYVDENGHTEEIIPAVPATCTSTGLTEGKKCSVCGTVTVEQTTTEMLAHTYDKKVATDTYKATDATCTAKATYYYSCSCSAKGTETFEYGEKLSHTEATREEDRVEASCGGEGSYKLVTYCSVCKYVIKTETKTITATGKHTWSTTFTSNGDGKDSTHYQICTVCSAKNAAVEHTWNEGVEAPEADCENGGAMTYTCTADGCGATYTVPVDPDGHTYGDWIPEIPATCISEGTKGHYHCNACGKDFDAEKNVIADLKIEKNDNHVNTVDKEKQDSTCTQVGYKAGTYCNDCKTWVSGHEEIPVIGHKNKVYHTKVDATCVDTGTIEYWSCPDCGKNFIDEACTTVAEKLVIEINPDNHDIQTHEAKTPTCTEIGWDAYETCKREGCKYTTYVEKEALDHDFSNWIEIKAPTCLETGEEERKCKREGCGESEIQPIAKLAHAFTSGEYKWKNTADSKTHSEKCATAGCNEYGPEVVCDFEAVVTNPTCFVGGFTTYTCKICNNGYSSDNTEKREHKYVYVQASTTEHIVKCEYADCNYELTEACVDTESDNNCNCDKCDNLVKHTYVDATCDNPATCTVCGFSSGEALGHDYSSAVTAPTCTEKGYTTYTCLRCSYSYVDNYVDKNGHTEEIIPAVPATCTSTGLTEGKKCSVCGTVTVEQTTTEMLAHTEATREENRVEASCGSDGSYNLVTYCSVCKDVIKTEFKTIPATGSHNYATEVEGTKVPATCKNTGSVTMKCGCGATEEKLLPVDENNHISIVTDKAVEATCYSTGLAEGSHCSDCGKVLVAQNVTETIAHTSAEAVIENNVEATCENAGSYDEVIYCSVCKSVGITKEISRNKVTVEALKHDWAEIVYTWTDDNSSCTAERVCRRVADHKQSAVATVTSKVTIQATCTEKGTTTYTAAFSEGWATEQTKAVVDISEKGHNMQKVAEAVEATCTINGKTATISCLNGCGKTEGGEIIPASGHNMVAGEVVAPTCEADGYTVYTCSNNCGTTEKKDIIGAIGHEYSSVVTLEPSCTVKGVMTYTCKNDSTHTYMTTIPATGHKDDNKDGSCDMCGEFACKHTETVIVDASPATCEFDGYSGDTVCSRCGYLISKGTTVPSKGHEWGATPIEVIPANCSTAITMVYKCKRCPETENRYEGSADKSVHTMTIVERVDPTCENDGYIYYVCTLCGGYIQFAELKAKGHADKDKDGFCDDTSCGSPLTPEAASKCNCLCHNESPIMKFIYKIVRFFWKLFRMSKICECGVEHY